MNKCEEAQEKIPLEKSNTQFLRFYQGSIGYMATISVMPATMVLDFILMGRCRYSCSENQNESFLVNLFPTTTFTYEHTKDMRCPDNSYYIQKFIEVAECYEKRGDKISLEKALSQLNFLEEEYNSSFTCIQIRDGQIIKLIKERINKKMLAMK
jgi:hypothetical protein